MKKNNGTVFIVHHVDTEGPLYEPLDETYSRLETTFQIELTMDRTFENLEKLRNGEFKEVPFHISKEIKKVIDPHLINFLGSWYEVEKMLTNVNSKKFREKHSDSFGNPWVINWHIMDHVGFSTNERSRDLGYLNIFNRYESILNKKNIKNDEVHWHFHPISFFKEAHICATSYENSYYELHQIICRRLLEKNWFPIINRAGFHTIRPDSNWFLEQWLPFDASNQSIEEERTEQKDANFGRFGDWKGSPDDWSLYHPDLYDWRKKGNLKRVISRVLNLKTRFRNITESEIEKAFLKARNNENVYLGITNHDFRDMEVEINDFLRMLDKVASKYKDVPYEFSGALNAFRKCLGYGEKDIEKNKIDFKLTLQENLLKVEIEKGEIFGAQPYLAIKTKSGQYFHDNFDFGEFKKEYYYTFDRHTIYIENVDRIAVASNDKYGNCVIKNLKINKQ